MPENGEGKQSSEREHTAAFVRVVDEGQDRLDRSWPSLLATGSVGGFDVGTGVLALLVVKEATGNDLLAALAFSIGFVALILAGSELFTENFLVPVIAFIARDEVGIPAVARLWLGTFATNLVAGWVFMALVVAALPGHRTTAVEAGAFYPALGTTGQAFASAILGGIVITLLTWVEHRSPTLGGRVVGAVATGFLIASVPLNHAVIGALEMSGALISGATFGYADAFGAVGWAALGNAVGGIGFVTMLRLVQIGRGAVEAEHNRSPHARD